MDACRAFAIDEYATSDDAMACTTAAVVIFLADFV